LAAALLNDDLPFHPAVVRNDGKISTNNRLVLRILHAF
jgi:hypothetical protein